MVKKKYKITATGNIKDALRTAKIKFSCVSSDMQPFDKTVKITQSKATRDHYCRPAFYTELENVPVGGKQVKMSLIWNGVNFKVEHPDWVSMTKINESDNISPIQYWLEISPNIGLPRSGYIKISYEYGGLPYSQSFLITQFGKEASAAKIECNPTHLQGIDYEKTIIPITVDYVGVRKIREPIFSPFEKDWLRIQTIKEYKSTNTITATYNVIIDENESQDPRMINIVFSGIGDNNKEVNTSCYVFQVGNPNLEEEK